MSYDVLHVALNEVIGSYQTFVSLSLCVCVCVCVRHIRGRVEAGALRVGAVVIGRLIRCCFSEREAPVKN